MDDHCKPTKVLGFDHLTIIVEDIQKTREFYVGILGMTEVTRPEFDFDGAWFQTGSVQIHVTLADANSGLAGWGDRRVVKVSRGHHFAFEVASLEQAFESLKSDGIKIADGPKVRPDGVKQLYIRDPDGHLVELFSHSV
ncbi:MAG: VOC family protein [Planctomycetota bacterium]